MQGISRWLNRVWNLVLEERKTASPADADEREIDRREFQRRMHLTIRKVEGDFESFRFNTAIAALMEYTNYLQDAPVALDEDWDDAIDNLLRLMAPITPHIAEELWARRGKPYSIHHQAFPAWDEALAAAEDVTLIVQVNGRLRDRIVVPASISEDDARRIALESERVQQYVSPGVERVIHVPGRLINIVTK